MPTDIRGLFPGALADIRAATGATANPWFLAQSVFPQAQQVSPGATLEGVVREAQAYLGGQPAPPPTGPSPAESLQGQQPGVPVSGDAGMGTGAGGPAPTGGGLPASVGGRMGSLTGNTFGDIALSMLVGLVNPMASLPFTMGRSLDATMDVMGMGKFDNTLDAQMALNALPDIQAALGSLSPQGVTVSGVPGQAGVTLRGGGGDDPSGGGASTGEGGPSSGPGTSGTGGGGGAGAGDGAGAGVFDRGGHIPGRGRKRVKVKGGEFVMNAAATDRFRPTLEAMNAAVPPDPELDKLLDAARRHLEP